MKYICFFLIVIINFSSFANNKISIYSNEGKRINIFLPKGYCDITNTNSGKLIMNHLKKVLSKKPASAKVVYRLCKNINKNYPWGYIALLNDKMPLSFTQKNLNKLYSKQLNNNIKNIIKDVNKTHKKQDIDINVKDVGALKKFWDDENVYVFYTIANTKVLGENLKEIFIGGMTLIDRHIIGNYLYEKFGEHETLKNARAIVFSAKKIKQNN